MKTLFALGLLLATSFAFAVPTQLGFSGGFSVPNATIQQGVALSILVDESENGTTVIGPGRTLDSSDKLPKTQLSFNLGKSLEMCIGYHKRDQLFSGPVVRFNTSFSTTNASLKYALPYTFMKGKFAIGAHYDTTSISVDGDSTGGSIDRWVGLLCGSFPVFNKTTTFTTALLFPSGDTDKQTGYGFSLEKQLPNNGAIGVEYLLNSTNGYRLGGDDFGSIYLDVPFGGMFTGRLAVTGLNDDTKLAYGMTAKF
jgi:hypothetical protein